MTSLGVSNENPILDSKNNLTEDGVKQSGNEKSTINLDKFDRFVEEAKYFDIVTNYALRSGWVKPEDVDFLIEGFLRPIHEAYASVLKEVTEFIESGVFDEDSPPQQYANDKEATIARITNHLNRMLARTVRIGSTTHDNVINGCRDEVNYWGRVSRNLHDEVGAYASEELFNTISNTLEDNSLE